MFPNRASGIHASYYLYTLQTHPLIVRVIETIVRQHLRKKSVTHLESFSMLLCSKWLTSDRSMEWVKTSDSGASAGFKPLRVTK